MEEKKKVYIRGYKGRGQEVIDILTRLGAINACGDNGEYEDSIYFISHNNRISLVPIGSEVADIIMDNYKEIKIPEKSWKDEDILIRYTVLNKYKDDDICESYYIFDNKNVYYDTMTSIDKSEGLPILVNSLDKFHKNVSKESKK